jgi:hypothetical protein
MFDTIAKELRSRKLITPRPTYRRPAEPSMGPRMRYP